jgi:flagellar basal-body rod modification protein FlgD
MLENGQAKFSYFLPESEARATLRITDSSGDVVFIQDAQKEPGVHDFAWDGLDSLGNSFDDGPYSFEVTAFDADDNPITVDHTVFGRVTGVEFEDGNAILTIGEVLVPLSQINGVSMVEQPQGN